jgi:hypothetical protein
LSRAQQLYASPARAHGNHDLLKRRADPTMKFGGVLSTVALLAAGIVSVATPHRRAPERHVPSQAATEPPRLPVALPEREIPGKANADLFASRDWTPRAPRAPVQAAQERALVPSAPPNPYRFAGTVHYGGSLKAVFIREGRVYIAQPEETLDGGYKVLSVTRDAVTLLYTPSDIEIALALDRAPDTAVVQAQPPLQPNATASPPIPPGSPLVVR